ncbi:uncharacterized [Tachysurus ichikawai]
MDDESGLDHGRSVSVSFFNRVSTEPFGNQYFRASPRSQAVDVWDWGSAQMLVSCNRRDPIRPTCWSFHYDTDAVALIGGKVSHRGRTLQTVQDHRETESDISPY